MTNLTLQLPDWLAQELTQANETFAAQIMERGLRAWKIEQALQKYAQGGWMLGRRPSWPSCRKVTSCAKRMRLG